MAEEMKSTESVALETLALTLQKIVLGREQAVLNAIDSVAGIAILAKDRKPSVKAVELLGDYAGIQPTSQQTTSEVLNPQRIASSKICGIALVLKDPDVDNAALTALEKRLEVTTLGKGETHTEALTDIAVIAMQSGSAQKERACKILSAYAHKSMAYQGYVGYHAFPKTQALAEQLIGVLGTS